MTLPATERVIAIVREVGGIGLQEEVDETTPLIGEGVTLDSVAVLEMLVALENEFGCTLEASELLEADALDSVGALARFVRSKCEGRA